MIFISASTSLAALVFILIAPRIYEKKIIAFINSNKCNQIIRKKFETFGQSIKTEVINCFKDSEVINEIIDGIIEEVTAKIGELASKEMVHVADELVKYEKNQEKARITNEIKDEKKAIAAVAETALMKAAENGDQRAAFILQILKDPNLPVHDIWKKNPAAVIRVVERYMAGDTQGAITAALPIAMDMFNITK